MNIKKQKNYWSMVFLSLYLSLYFILFSILAIVSPTFRDIWFKLAEIGTIFDGFPLFLVLSLFMYAGGAFSTCYIIFNIYLKR